MTILAKTISTCSMERCPSSPHAEISEIWARESNVDGRSERVRFLCFYTCRVKSQFHVNLIWPTSTWLEWRHTILTSNTNVAQFAEQKRNKFLLSWHDFMLLNSVRTQKRFLFAQSWRVNFIHFFSALWICIEYEKMRTLKVELKALCKKNYI